MALYRKGGFVNPPASPPAYGDAVKTRLAWRCFGSTHDERDVSQSDPSNYFALQIGLASENGQTVVYNKRFFEGWGRWRWLDWILRAGSVGKRRLWGCGLPRSRRDGDQQKEREGGEKEQKTISHSSCPSEEPSEQVEFIQEVTKYKQTAF